MLMCDVCRSKIFVEPIYVPWAEEENTLSSDDEAELPVEIKVPRLRMFLVGTFKDKLMEAENSQEILHSMESHLKELNSKPYREHLVHAPDQTAFLVTTSCTSHKTILLLKRIRTTSTIFAQCFLLALLRIS